MSKSFNSTQPIVGVDFDNTLAIYDETMHAIALELGLIQPHVPKVKKEVRDAIRNLSGGEIKWQILQGLVYGPRMHEAQVAEGAVSFFQEWVGRGGRIYIVSHKTEFANYDETGTNLRQMAMAWLKNKGFWGSNGSGLEPENVYWESTRLKKINRVARLGCSHFIDDLEEVFQDSAFPAEVEGILYAPKLDPSHTVQTKVARSWNEVLDLVSSSAKARVPGLSGS